MSAVAAALADWGSLKVLVLLWPAEPILPHRVVIAMPSWEISQNLFELPATNSKCRTAELAGDAGAFASWAEAEMAGVDDFGFSGTAVVTGAGGGLVTASRRTPT